MAGVRASSRRSHAPSLSPGPEGAAARRPRVPPQLLDRTWGNIEGIPETASLGLVSAKRAKCGRTRRPTFSGVASPLSLKRRPSLNVAVACATASVSLTPVNQASSCCKPWACAIVSRPAASRRACRRSWDTAQGSAVSCGRVAVALCSGGSPVSQGSASASAERSSRASDGPHAPWSLGAGRGVGRLEQLRGPLGNPIREAMRAQVPRRGGKIRARALPIHHIQVLGPRPSGCPPGPSVPPPAAPPRPRAQRGGSVNATLRRGHGGFGTRDCGQDLLEAPWAQDAGGAAPVIVSVSVSLATIRQTPYCSARATQAVTWGGVWPGLSWGHRRW